jgi:hypothetical protein
MKFNSQICTTKEQSERLLALGLKRETADMTRTSVSKFAYDLPYIASRHFLITHKGAKFANIEPAWSLHRLIEMMPCGFQDEHYRNFVLKINSQDVSYVYNYIDDEGYGQSDSIDVDDIYHNLYDGIIAHIKWLIKKGYFNKEYLEE